MIMMVHLLVWVAPLYFFIRAHSMLFLIIVDI